MKKLMLFLPVLLCLLMAGCDVQKEFPAADPTEAPATEAPEAAADAGEEAAEEANAHANAYLVVTVANSVYEPIPLEEAGRYTVKRGDYVNIIEVTEDSVKMAESSCDNQDCVYQGTVSLENKDGRVLQNMIICLPNEVILELYTYDELQEALPGWLEGQAE